MSIMPNSDKNGISDIVIIGGGPAGLFAAFYAGMRHLSVKVIESMPQPGGQLAALYPEKYIYDVAGLPKITAQQLVDNLLEQCSLFNPTFCLEERVIQVIKHDERFFEVQTNKDTHFGKTIIITAGCGAFEPRRLDLEEASKYEKRGLSYFISNQSHFKDKNVLIAGGGDSAIDWALMLEPIAKNVTLIHRRDKFRAHEHSLSQVQESSVNILTPYKLSHISGENRVERAIIQHIKTEEIQALDIDEIIVSYGFVSSLGPIAEWGLNINSGSIVVDTHMATNIPGIYAAGDITTYPGKIKLIAVGFGEAPTAVNNAAQYIDPMAKVQPGHSSNMKL